MDTGGTRKSVRITEGPYFKSGLTLGKYMGWDHDNELKSPN